MDDIEKKLYHDLNLKTEIPDECEKIIKEALNKRKKHYSWAKNSYNSLCKFTNNSRGSLCWNKSYRNNLGKTRKSNGASFGRKNSR